MSYVNQRLKDLDCLVTDGILPLWVYTAPGENIKLSFYAPGDDSYSHMVSRPERPYRLAFIIKPKKK